MLLLSVICITFSVQGNPAKNIYKKKTWITITWFYYTASELDDVKGITKAASLATPSLAAVLGSLEIQRKAFLSIIQPYLNKPDAGDLTSTGDSSSAADSSSAGVSTSAGDVQQARVQESAPKSADIAVLGIWTIRNTTTQNDGRSNGTDTRSRRRSHRTAKSDSTGRGVE